jgi:hypothetical protein
VERGVWERVFATLVGDADFEEVYMDSSMIRVHQHAAGARKKKGPRRLAAPAAG